MINPYSGVDTDIPLPLYTNTEDFRRFFGVRGVESEEAITNRVTRGWMAVITIL